jgi:PAS domain S-box-containing protein
MLIVAFRLAWSKIVMPVRELRDEALRVSEHGAPSNPGDELGVVSTVVNEMSENVGRLRDERTRVERRLRRIEADYQFVFDNAVAGIFQFNAAGEVILANPATARILGYRTPAELAYSVKNVHETMFADPDHESRVKALVAEEETIKSETKMIRKDGRELWVLESSAIVHRTTNNYCCESVVVDITEMKKAQEQLRELSGLLLDSQERERRRIARELHDSTGQVLAALEMNLGRLRDFLEGAHDSLSATGELATQCSREIRSMSYLLHPPLLDELGLAYAVRDYAEGFSARSGIDVALELPEHLERLSQDMETALFRVIQEALTNIHRHAKSPAARIRLGVCSRSVMVEIEDDGCGIPPELLSSDNHSLSGMGVGMRGMEERLHQLGGRLTIVSSGDGTRVRGELPRRCRDDGDAAARAAVDASPHGPTPLSS